MKPISATEGLLLLFAFSLLYNRFIDVLNHWRLTSYTALWVIGGVAVVITVAYLDGTITARQWLQIMLHFAAGGAIMTLGSYRRGAA